MKKTKKQKKEEFKKVEKIINENKIITETRVKRISKFGFWKSMWITILGTMGTYFLILFIYFLYKYLTYKG